MNEEQAIPTGKNKNGGNEYRMTAEVGKLFGEGSELDPVKQATEKMNAIVKIAQDNGFIREPMKFQSQMGVLNFMSWQKDVLEKSFWKALFKNEKKIYTPMEIFFNSCIEKSWIEAVDFLSDVIKKIYG